MEPKTAFICYLSIVLFSFQNVNANNRDALQVIFDRIDKLESNDVANKREIASLKAEIKSLKINSLKTENDLRKEIKTLKLRLIESEVNNAPNESKEIIVNTFANYEQSKKDKNIMRKSVKAREAVENEIAFYSTHSQHDVQHLGQNQIIVFDQAITNVGNGYNSQRGEFAAPVDGTYVFHVTMMGKDVHAITSKHFSAYIDVNGKPYSQLWVEPYQQSSQMFVINLTAGQIVSVKNRVQDDGFIGQHMSTFSGFLLYQKYSSLGIIGK